jgi:hypothetical protein
MGFHDEAAEEARAKAVADAARASMERSEWEISATVGLEVWFITLGVPRSAIPEINFPNPAPRSAINPRIAATWTFEGYSYKAVVVGSEVEEVELLARGSWHRVYGKGTWNP